MTGLERRHVVAGLDVVLELEDALQHHRHREHRRAAVLGELGQRVLGVELAAQHQRRAHQRPDLERREPPRVEQRRRDQGVLAGRERDAGEDRVDRRRCRSARDARRPSACPWCPRSARSSCRPAASWPAACEPSAPMRPSRVSSPQHPAPSVQAQTRFTLSGTSLEAVGEVGVDDDRADLLLLGDGLHLRRREPGVEQDDVGAELGDGEDRLDGAAVVAAQHGDAAAGADAAVREGAGEPVGALVDLLERHRAAVVDDRDAVRVAPAADDERGGRREAVAVERGREQRQPGAVPPGR